MTADTPITLAPCRYDDHASAILDIFNDAIANSTALYEYRPRTMQTMQAWFEAKRNGDFPVVGAFDADGQLLGFASWGAFRAFPAYKYTVSIRSTCAPTSAAVAWAEVVMSCCARRRGSATCM
jgi:L-amino acid N-acyltransferase YncA